MLRGEYTAQEFSPEMDAWLRMIAQTKEKRSSPMTDGAITKEEFQEMLKRAREKTSLSPAGLHYTIWKTMVEED